MVSRGSHEGSFFQYCLDESGAVGPRHQRVAQTTDHGLHPVQRRCGENHRRTLIAWGLKGMAVGVDSAPGFFIAARSMDRRSL